MPCSSRSASAGPASVSAPSSAISAGVLPDRLAVLAPVEREGPARQALARVPLALAVVQEAAGREAVAQAADQPVGEAALHRADGLGVPLVALEVVDRDEGRLAAHGQAHVAGGERGVDLAAERVERGPGLVGERLGDARVLGDAASPACRSRSRPRRSSRRRRSARRCGSAAWRRAGCGSRRSGGREVGSRPIQPAPGR